MTAIGVEINPGLLLVAVTVRFWVWPPPAVIPDSWITVEVVVFSTIVGGFGIWLIVGATLIGVTAIWRIPVPMLLITAPSFTVNVTVRTRGEGLVLVSLYVTDCSSAW